MSNRSTRFVWLMVCLALLMSMHLWAIYSDVGFPYALLYGPLLYIGQRTLYQPKLTGVFLLLHAIPFTLFGIWYMVTLGHTPQIYFQAYFTSMVLSLLVYTLVILNRRRKWSIILEASMAMLILQLTTISIIVAVSVSVLLFSFHQAMSFDVHPLMIIILLMGLSIFLILRYIYQAIRSSESEDALQPADRLNLSADRLQAYQARLEADMQTKMLFLRTNLSLDVLAQETEIPKHHFAVLFHTQIGKSFYEWLAEYRIAHAVKLLQEKRFALKIESLAYDCGYNSKTSFNKYFKQITGLTPSEFKEKQASMA